MSTESQEEPEPSELTDKRQRFIDEYLKDCNATRAAIRAGYAEPGARVEGHRLLTNANIRAEIDRRLNESAMSANEAVKAMADIARTRLNDFFVVREVQGYQETEYYVTVLAQRQRDEIEYIENFATEHGISLASENGPTAMGKRLEEAKEKLLEYELEIMHHGNTVTRLVADKPVVVERAELDLVALAKAQEEGRLKSYSLGKEGIKVEMHAADGALRDILKMHGMYEKDNEQRMPATLPAINIYTGAPPLSNTEKEVDTDV